MADSSKTTEQTELAPYQQEVRDVVAALDTDGRWGLTEEEAKRAGRGKASARMAEVPRTISGCACDTASGRDSHFGRSLAV